MTGIKKGTGLEEGELQDHGSKQHTLGLYGGKMVEDRLGNH